MIRRLLPLVASPLLVLAACNTDKLTSMPACAVPTPAAASAEEVATLKANAIAARHNFNDHQAHSSGNGSGLTNGNGGGPGGGGDAISPNAATAAELIAAMDVPVAVTGATLTDMPNQAAVFTSLGTLVPVTGGNFAYLSTGVAGATTAKSLDSHATVIKNDGNSMSAVGSQSCADVGSVSNDCASLAFSFVVPAGMHAVAFDFNFLSGEYPEFVGSEFNDTFQVSLKSNSYNFANIVYDSHNDPIDINSVLFTEPCGNLSGTGFDVTVLGLCDAGATGLLSTTAPVAPGETVTMNFEIYDASDNIYDSAVMIDNFHFTDGTVGTPVTGTPTPAATPSPSPSPSPSPTASPTPSPAPTATPTPAPACGST